MDTDSTTLFVSSCLLTLRRSHHLQGRYATLRACVTLLPFSEHSEYVMNRASCITAPPPVNVELRTAR